MPEKFSRKTFILDARGRRLVLGEQTKVMGVVNLTPDSFSRDGRISRRKNDPVEHAAYALRLEQEGADIIDLGGESTRPDACVVSSREEIKRVIPTLTLLRKRSKVFISVDTYKLEVAQPALDAGADIVNNIMGTRLTKPFLSMVKNYGAALVLMHMRGVPQTMQKKTNYGHLINNIIDELRISLEKCLEIGIKSDKIIIDPGIGFAKTAEQNFEILKYLSEFQKLRCPILVGTSKKSFIGKVLNADVAQRAWGTAAAVTASVLGGCHIVRVHDVGEAKQVVTVADAILNPSLGR